MSALLPYDLVFAICILLLLLIGVFSATHIQLFSGKRYRHLEVQEKQLLRLPGVWLSASMDRVPNVGVSVVSPNARRTAIA